MGTKPHLFLSQVDNLITWQETHSLSKIPSEDCHKTPSSVVRGGEQSQLIPELDSGKVSVVAHPLLLQLTLALSLQTGDRHLCAGHFLPYTEHQKGKAEGIRGNEGQGREGTCLGHTEGLRWQWGRTDPSVLTHSFKPSSHLKISMFSSGGWNTWRFLALQVVTPSVGTCPGLGGRRQRVIPECLEVTPCEDRECLGASIPFCAPISCRKRNRSQSFKINSWWAWFTHSLQPALGLTLEKSEIAEGGHYPDKQLPSALSQG